MFLRTIGNWIASPECALRAIFAFFISTVSEMASVAISIGKNHILSTELTHEQTAMGRYGPAWMQHGGFFCCNRLPAVVWPHTDMCQWSHISHMYSSWYISEWSKSFSVTGVSFINHRDASLQENSLLSYQYTRLRLFLQCVRTTFQYHVFTFSILVFNIRDMKRHKKT